MIKRPDPHATFRMFLAGMSILLFTAYMPKEFSQVIEKQIDRIAERSARSQYCEWTRSIEREVADQTSREDV